MIVVPLAFRRRGLLLSRRWFTKLSNSSELRHGAADEGLASTKDASAEVNLSPLYTQRVGMFLEPGVLFKDHHRKRFLTFRLYFFSIVSLTVILGMIKIVPPGYVGLIVRRDGSIDQFNNEKRLALFYVPFMETPVAFRTTPIRKKIIEKFTTKDGKQVEAVIFLDLQAKLAYASHVYAVFGVNFSKSFVEKELLFDVEQVVKRFNRDELLVQSDEVERLFASNGQRVATLKSHGATAELVERFQDAGAFHKIVVSNIVSHPLVESHDSEREFP
ncbi:prohibitin family protein [Babesia ovata]|uniref:Prohibitin family protein n=1 Tax=Babesia ovata TaxID=189622 RepID=A0A2H6KES7_9APIC|nr:prohibitin family protein [Babesia ovata]GBE61486.1 prohibitin family protein [Babesia ovata]